MSDIYGPSDDTESMATIHPAAYSEDSAANTGFHIPKEDLPKTVRESER
jgi:hypothetical protein